MAILVPGCSLITFRINYVLHECTAVHGVSKLVDVTVSDPESRCPLNLMVTTCLCIIGITYNWTIVLSWMISTIYGHHRCTSTFINLHKYGAIDRYIQLHWGPHGALIPVYNYQSTLADLKCVCRHSYVLLCTMCRYLLVGTRALNI